MEDQEQKEAPPARGLSVRIHPEDAAALRLIAAETDSKLRDVLAVLAQGCAVAIRSGSLRRSIAQRKLQALQALAGLPPSPPREVRLPESLAVEVASLPGMQIPSLAPRLSVEADGLFPPPAPRTYT